jgi:hypothetical protein
MTTDVTAHRMLADIKGGVRGYEAYEVKYKVTLVRVPFYFIKLLPTSLLYISILLMYVCTYMIRPN